MTLTNIISTFVAYVKQTWENSPSTASPLSADRLNFIEDGIQNNSDAIEAIAAAVTNSIANDPDKIASLAAAYALQAQITTNASNITTLNSNLSKYIPIIMPQYSSFADFIDAYPSSGGVVFGRIVYSGGDPDTDSPHPTRTTEYWNTVMMGTSGRRIMITNSAFASRNVIYLKVCHDSTWYGWYSLTGTEV